jgi:hypothetical protein
MKRIIERVFPRNAPEQPSHVSSQLTNSDIESYYQRLVGECLRRLLVPPDSVAIEVRRAGSGPTGLTSYAAYVRILRWDPVLTPVLLQNAPVVDERVRKAASISVILQQTHFGGIWFQATSATAGAPTTLQGIATELPG